MKTHQGTRPTHQDLAKLQFFATEWKLAVAAGHCPLTPHLARHGWADVKHGAHTDVAQVRAVVGQHHTASRKDKK